MSDWSDVAGSIIPASEESIDTRSAGPVSGVGIQKVCYNHWDYIPNASNYNVKIKGVRGVEYVCNNEHWIKVFWIENQKTKYGDPTHYAVEISPDSEFNPNSTFASLVGAHRLTNEHFSVKMDGPCYARVRAFNFHCPEDYAAFNAWVDSYTTTEDE